jgi:hypothetical protein
LDFSPDAEFPDMPARLWIVATFAPMLLGGPTLGRADDAKPATVSFDREVRPILRKRCNNCHNAERPRGELDLSSFAGVMAGASTGKVVVAGAPEDSPLYTLPAHLDEPHMPPNAPKIPQRELDVFRRWIEGGLAEAAGDTADVAEVAAPRGLILARATPRARSVTALAVSPIEPIAAASGHAQVLLFDLAARKLLGALAFPEGDVFALRFSRDGRRLLVAGGDGAESGKVALFDAKTWARLATLGDEPDAILAADLSPDIDHVVLGGPTRVVKVLAHPGAAVVQTFRKPTDWVTAVGFSPDGLLVAAGDRFGGLFVWEARSGVEFLSRRGHPRAITAIGWTKGGDALVTTGEDGAVQVWDLHSGRLAARWEGHAGGALAVDVHPSGRIATAGRDRRVKVWEADGRPVADLGPTADQATRVAWSPDGRALVSGDWSGELRVWDVSASTSTPLPLPLAPPPSPLALVEPVLAPARAPGPGRSSTATANRAERPGPVDDDLDAALDSAREAAAAAQRTFDRLAVLARSRGRLPAVRPSPDRRAPSADDALDAARAASTYLRTALDADPDNTPLARAVVETDRAVKLLEAKKGNHGTRRASPPVDR